MLAAVLLEIPIAMVILSRVLSPRLNRWASIVAAVLAVPLILAGSPSDLDDMFFTGVEVVALALIIWYAWKWPKREANP